MPGTPTTAPVTADGRPATMPRDAVQAALDAEVALRAAELEPVGADVRLLVDAIADLLAGGKRLRAAFCYWGYLAGGGTHTDAVVRVAAAMEMFQAAALIHDDVMDDSDTRRGAPAVHRRLQTVHDEHGWGGPGDRFGAAGAILAGNLCLTWTDSLFATSGLPADELDRARPEFDRMRTQLMGGQFLDVLESARGWESLDTDARVAASRHVIRYKSAKYSVEQPLLVGAAAAGLPDADLAALSTFGLAVGEAFQLRDDLLGVYGDPDLTGKPAGDDLREGKRTVLVAYALDALQRPGREDDLARFTRHLGDPALAGDGVAWMRDTITASGAVDRVEDDITRLVGEAHAALDTCRDLTDLGRGALARLVEDSTRRTY